MAQRAMQENLEKLAGNADHQEPDDMTESTIDELKRKNREQGELLRQAEELRKRLQLNCEAMQSRLDEALLKASQLERSNERLQSELEALAKTRQLERSQERLQQVQLGAHELLSNHQLAESMSERQDSRSNTASPSLGDYSASSSNANSPLSHQHQHQAHQQHQPHQGLGLNAAALQLAASNGQAPPASQHQEQQSTAVALAAASQFLSALARSQVGGQLSELDRLAQSHLLASTLGAAANVSAADIATNLTNHLAKQQHQHQRQHPHLNHHQHHLNGAPANPLSNSHTDSNNNNTSASNHLRPGSVAQQLASVAAAANSGLGAGSPASAAAAAVAAQLSAAAAAAAAGTRALGQSSASSGAAAGAQPLGPAGPIPHPHSHHALSHPAASLLINNPHYQTVRTKYSTRRYSRRRVGPEEAMADPAIRATVQLKMPVVPKTILIVLKHRLTVQTAITLACAQTGERLRKGAIQKKLEAMFREPGAVDSFLAEWDQPR